MIDATLPTLHSPSIALNPRPTSSSDSNSSEGDVFPFLVHSQDSVTNGEPPDVDNSKLARQKRRRTSAEDQSTLETEYKRNPKPDKAARLEIVKRVSLGEKEVQIWFQNRRQNTRRKSRPLLPHEIAAFGLGGMAALSSNPLPIDSHDGTEERNQPSSSSEETLSVSHDKRLLQGDKYHVSEVASFLPISMIPEEDAKTSTETSNSTTESTTSSTVAKHLSRDLSVKDLSPASQPLDLSQLLPASLGYLSNRRNAISSYLSTPTAAHLTNPPATLSSRHSLPASFLDRSTDDVSTPSSSQVRLSMSLDGKAELVSLDLSPQRPNQLLFLSSGASISHRRLGGLKRSLSAIPLGRVLRKSLSNLPLAPQIPTGRSRDARTWEFCCDTESRDELTTQAENESSGSAVAAISLLRSTSSSTSKSNVNKRNAPALKADIIGHGKKPKLARASSSLARLQDTGKILGSPSGDSDKENWLPLDNPGNPRRRPLGTTRPPKQRRQRVLEEAIPGGPKMSNSMGGTFHKKPATSDGRIFEDEIQENEAHPEVERFMRGEVSPSKKGDLDCIQGLLSLSQGTWR